MTPRERDVGDGRRVAGNEVKTIGDAAWLRRPLLD